MLHQFGVLFDLYHDARKHNSKTFSGLASEVELVEKCCELALIDSIGSSTIVNFTVFGF